MKTIDPKSFTENVIKLIGERWMLVTPGTPDHFNTMTASWGGIGYLWNKPVVFVFVRPERHTFGFMEESECFTLSFLAEENRKALSICGSTSGRDTDKVKAAGLNPLTTELGNVTFEEAEIVIECKKMYGAPLKEDGFIDKSIMDKWYDEKHGGLHKMYVGEILALQSK